MIYLPVIGALLEATGTIIEKRLLKFKSFNYKNYTVYSFLTIVVAMVPFIYFFWDIKPEAFLLKNLLIFLFIILSAALANILVYYSYKREDLCELEPVRLMQPLFTIVLAFILYTSERNISLVVLALIASLALVITHIKKNHFVYNKYIIAALAGSLFFAVELVASKAILEYYSSFTFYFLRCLFILIIVLAIFRPDFKAIDKHKKLGLFILVSGLVWVFYRVILYWGYEVYGIVFTTILFILTPVFILSFAKIFLKEKLTFRQIISTIIMVICVIAAIVIEGG